MIHRKEMESHVMDHQEIDQVLNKLADLDTGNEAAVGGFLAQLL